MAEPVSDPVWRFEAGVDLTHVERALQEAELTYSRHSTTVSYLLRTDGTPRLDSYEMHVVYRDVDLRTGEPLVEKSYLRSSYSILETDQGTRWISEVSGEEIAELDFYGAVLYSKPDRMISLQQISFETSSGSYLVELNMESKLLVLISLSGTEHIPGLLARYISPVEFCRSEYLLELFIHNGGPLSS